MSAPETRVSRTVNHQLPPIPHEPPPSLKATILHDLVVN
jgi:hypothetical protein